MSIPRDLAAYADALRVVSRDAEGVQWSQSLEALAKLPEVPAAAPQKEQADHLAVVLKEIEWFDRVGGSAQLFFKDKWLSLLATRTSRSVVDNLRRNRRDIESALQKLHTDRARGWAETALKLPPPDLRRFLENALSNLRSRFHHDLESLVSSVVAGSALPIETKLELLENLQALMLLPGCTARTTPPDAYFLLQVGLTFGCAPAAGYVELPAEIAASPPAEYDLDFALIDASLPRSQVIIYDLATLLEGFAGSVESGLNYNIVAKLDTIHEVSGRDSAIPLSADIKYLRLDSSDRRHARAIVSKRSLDEIRTGPSPALWRYHELAEASISETPGFLLDNAEMVVDSFANEEGGEHLKSLEHKRLNGELYHIRRFYRGEEVPSAARMAASTIATSRLSNTELLLDQKLVTEQLPGERLAQRRELVLTYLAQANRLEELLSRVPSESATTRPYSAIEQMATLKLMEDGGRLPSIKATCFAVGRGVVLD